MATRQPKTSSLSAATSTLEPAEPPTVKITKLDTIIALLRAPGGASICDLMEATGWQAHSVRGALSCALKKKRKLTVVSQKCGTERVYRIQDVQA